MGSGGDRIRAILWVARMFYMFWTFAGMYACHIHNMTNVLTDGPHKGETSYEALTKDHSHGMVLYDFGAEISFVYPPSTTKSKEKFEQRGTPGVFLGYKLQPGGKWARSYYVVPLTYFTSRDEKLRILETADVKFPSAVHFPLKKLYDIQQAHDALVANPYANQTQLLEHILSYGTRKQLPIQLPHQKSQVVRDTDDGVEEHDLSIFGGLADQSLKEVPTGLYTR